LLLGFVLRILVIFPSQAAVMMDALKNIIVDVLVVEVD
jgi:hypothetical protein